MTVKKNAMLFIMIVQYIPRVILTYPLSSKIIDEGGIVADTAWTGAGYNLMLYLMASHVSRNKTHFSFELPIVHLVPIWLLMKRPPSTPASAFLFFFFFFLREHVYVALCFFSGYGALFTGFTIFFFDKTFIKNRSHDTIHTFKNYFVTIFSVFNFQQNMQYPNTPYSSKISCSISF